MQIFVKYKQILNQFWVMLLYSFLSLSNRTSKYLTRNIITFFSTLCWALLDFILLSIRELLHLISEFWSILILEWWIQLSIEFEQVFFQVFLLYSWYYLFFIMVLLAQMNLGKDLALLKFVMNVYQISDQLMLGFCLILDYCCLLETVFNNGSHLTNNLLILIQYLWFIDFLQAWVWRYQIPFFEYYCYI